MSVPFLTINETQDIVKSVVEQVTRAVTGTMGPNGTLVLIKNGTSKKVTKDGVTVARSIKFADDRYELVNKVLTEPAIKTDDECGDGTTTTIFLTSGLYDVFSKNRGFRSHQFIDKIVNEVIERLKKDTITIDNTSEKLYQLALTSSNKDEALSKLVTEIYRGSGDNFPEVDIREGLTVEDRYQRSNGLTLSLVFSSPSFSLGGKGEFKDFVPVIVDNNLRSADALLPVITELNKKYPQSQIVIIGRSLDGDVNSLLLAVNGRIGQQRFVGLQTNAGGSVGSLLMQDLGVMFNVPVFNQVEDIPNIDIPVVTDTVTISGSRALLVNPSDETKARIDARVEDIKQELSEYEASERFSTRARFNEKRIRELKGELVTVYVGGNTISEVKERVDRFEDVIKAVKSALINGILPGVGTALLNAGCAVLAEYQKTDDEMMISILQDLDVVFRAQYLKLVGGYENVGGKLGVIDLTTGKLGTPSELGIFDTAYASITALRGGLQTAKILANLDSLIISDKLSAISIQSV